MQDLVNPNRDITYQPDLPDKEQVTSRILPSRKPVIIAIIITVLLVFSLGGGLAYYIQLKSGKESDVTSNTSTTSDTSTALSGELGKQVINKWQPLPKPLESLDNKVIFFSKEFGLAVSDPTGTDPMPLTEVINGKIDDSQIAPNHHYLFYTSDKLASLAEAQNSYFLLDLSNSSIQEVPMANIKKKIGEYNRILFVTWSTDSRKIVFEAFNMGESVIPKQDLVVGTYDIASGEVAELFSVNSTYLGHFYYDNTKGLLTYVSGWGSQDTAFHLFNEKTNQSTVITVPPNEVIMNLGDPHEYFFTIKQPSDSDNLRQLNMYHVLSPDRLITTLQLEEPYYFNFDIRWSKSGEYFAAFVTSDDLTEEKVNIYKKDGTLVSSTLLGTTEVVNRVLLSKEVIQNGVFSQNDKYFLIESRPSANYFASYSWLSIDVQEGKIVYPRITSEKLGSPLGWRIE